MRSKELIARERDMKTTQPKIKLSTLLAFTIGTSTSIAFALPPQSPISPKAASQFGTTLKELSQLNAHELKSLLDLKNNKNESISKSIRRTPEKGTWATLDPTADKVEGTSTEKVYKRIKIPNRNEIIVAVIDSGVDINHEDLKGHIWVNFAEFYGKPGVDDDSDGYIDDVFGWNFLGNKNGQNVGSTTLEVTRIYARLKKRKDAGEILSSEDGALYDQVSQEVEAGIKKAQTNLPRYQAFADAITLLKANGLKEETISGLDAVTSTDPDVIKAKSLATVVYNAELTSEDIAGGIENFHAQIDYYYNASFDSSTIVGDHPEILNEKGYGNGDVIGSDARHGTHVAGIIAANRSNHFGIDGQTRNIRIMPIRAVPDGDERDKDVGNAIRFAVDHGARVINMSFGKPYSPDKSYVDSAVKYAESKGVLMVHAAGNDSKNTESLHNNFPNRLVSAGSGKTREIETWIEVGASSKIKGLNLPADFSNYGKTSVDVFAPGKDIVSTVPGNKYASLSGTSMASPETAGVAALLLEKYPYASANEVKRAILETTTQYQDLSCALPGTADYLRPTLVLFSDLSATGGIVNAYQAMQFMKKL